jgi:hypothetical protein
VITLSDRRNIIPKIAKIAVYAHETDELGAGFGVQRAEVAGRGGDQAVRSACYLNPQQADNRR